jgi:hypothetical protein
LDRSFKKGGNLLSSQVVWYQNRAFTNPGITLDEMQNLIKEKMEEIYIDISMNEKIVDRLPYLKRWKQTAITPTNQRIKNLIMRSGNLLMKSFQSG